MGKNTSLQPLTEESSGTRIEKELIGNLMWCHSADFHDVTEGLTPECFTKPRYRMVYAAMLRRAERGEPINDPILLETEIASHECSGAGKITALEIVDEFGTGNPLLDTATYVHILTDCNSRRKMQKVLMEAIGKTRDTMVPLEETVSEAVEGILKSSTSLNMSSCTLRECFGRLEEVISRNLSGIQTEGLLTGFRRLDGYGGLHRGDLVIVAAESSQGKTAMALTMVMNAVRQSGAHAIVYSMEMSAVQLAARIVSPGAALPSSVIMYQTMTSGRMEAYDKSVGMLEGIADNVFFDESSSSSLTKILSSIRRHVAQHRVNLVMVDYLQIINIDTRNRQREEALADAARQLKNIAKELDIVVVLLSQFSRDGMVHTPSADRIRGSGEINEASDLTLIIYRPEVWGLSYGGDFANVSTQGTAMIKIDKDRFGAYGGTGQCIVGFRAQTTTFYDMDVVPKR